MATEPADPQWQRAKNGRFHKLFDLDPEAEGLTKVGGVYVIWHAGGRPAWVYVDGTSDLARSLHARGEEKEVIGYNLRGGLYVTWATIREEYQPGVVRFLTEQMKPVIANPRAPGSTVQAIAVRLPV